MSFDYSYLFHYLAENEREGWIPIFQNLLVKKLGRKRHGDFERWYQAAQSLPDIAATIACQQATVTVSAVKQEETPDQDAVKKSLQGMIPWRKGPFDYFGVMIDTEWRSDWKWERIQPHISSLRGRRVLDVGCGSGYHMWRMLGEGAECVLGIDPGVLFLIQFHALKRYSSNVNINFLPIRMEEFPAKGEWFDSVFSMGILYHRRSPLDHLLELKDALKPGGELILETLVIEGDEEQKVLCPVGRYSRMGNIYFLPTTGMLTIWLKKTGFTNIKLVDVSVTTVEEQRTTDWMRFQSLSDFLDPNDPSKTLEGYPAPVRATLIATK